MGKNDEKKSTENSSELDIEKAKFAKQKEEFEQYRRKSQEELQKEYNRLDEKLIKEKREIREMQGHDGHVGQSRRCYSDSKTNAAEKATKEAKKSKR